MRDMLPNKLNETEFEIINLGCVTQVGLIEFIITKKGEIGYYFDLFEMQTYPVN